MPRLPSRPTPPPTPPTKKVRGVISSMMTSIQAMTVAAPVAYACGVTEAWKASLTLVMVGELSVLS